MIAVIDYGMGNLASVHKACQFLGARVRVTSDPRQVANASALILPGVGAFGAATRELKRRRLVAPILDSIRDGKPFLGLCLGLQLLFEASEESPGARGLGVFPGRVRRLRAGANLKVPHMGWNQLEKAGHNGGDPLLRGVPDGAFMYFVHSFCVAAGSGRTGKQGVSAWTRYGERFASVVWDGANVWATQFHPEKSQRWGLRILRNYLSIAQEKRC